MIYTMYLPVFWGMNPGEPSFTRFQARKKCFLHWSLNHSCQLRGDLYNGLGLLLDDWGKSVFPRKVRAETQTWVGEQSSIGRQADQNYSDGAYYGNLELALIFSTTKDLLKTKQAKDSGRRSGAVIEYHVHEGKFNMKLASMLQHRRMCTTAIYRDHLHCTLSEFIYYLKHSKEDFYSQSSNDPYGNPQPIVHFFGPRGWWAEHNT